MPSPIGSANTIGPVTFSANIPADNNYGGSAALTATLQNVQIGAMQFTPQNNQWVVNNATVGTTAVSFTANYVPATAVTLGTVAVTSMTVTVEGRNPPQQFSGTVFVWTGSGSVIVPS